MKSNHTPGPWYDKKTSSDQGLIISEPTGKTVAVAYDPEDAPLLAAAPELRAALEEIAERAESMAQEADPNSDEHSGLIRMRDDARAAIAKAEPKK